MATKLELELRETLLTSGMVQPIKTSKKAGRVSIICRQVPGQESSWLKALQTILLAFKDTPDLIHACRQYVIKDDKMVFGWSMSIEGSTAEIKAALEKLKLILEAIEPEEPEQQYEPKKAKHFVQNSQYVSPYAKEDPSLLAEMGIAGSTAAPRPPSMSEEEMDKVPPPNARPHKITLVTKGVDQKTKQPVVIQEMPLPHVYTEDMNAPNSKDKGAKYLG